ncbi:MAG: hypothetical protein BGO78_13600 [Chloroflexi bacterium 44-23]|nr:MAG: hypothetical protein BGO78_13600 [Chloroflexi bacterium 44-23]
MAYTYFSKLFLILTVLLSNLGEFEISNQWATPQQIPNYERTSRPPFIIADHQNRIHAFNYESINATNNAVFYRSWTPDGGWKPPVDIILAGQGGGPATLQDVKLDQSGNFHLVFYISSTRGGNLYYSHAYIDAVDISSAWSSPTLIGPDAGPLAYSFITIDQNGTLLVFYAGELSATGLYLVTSEDLGQNWSQPILLSATTVSSYSVGAIRSLVDDDGSIHVVWSLINDTGIGEEVHYGRLNKSRDALEKEIVIARREGDDYSTTWPDIIRADDQLLLFYQDSFPATRFMRTSKDNGDSWSLPIQPFPFIGEYETTAMVKDSLGKIHLLLGNRTIDPEIHGMWYSQWLGTRWSTLSAITYGKKTAAFDPSVPRAVVLGGNLLFVTWWNDTRVDDRTGAWYSFRRLDAPPISPEPYPTLSVTQEVTEIVVPVVIKTKTIEMPAQPGTAIPFTTKPTNYFPARSIFWALIPVFGLLVFFYYYKKRHF